MPLWVRHGTKIEGESRSSSARFAGSSTDRLFNELHAGHLA
jgi:hypothetical protein